MIRKSKKIAALIIAATMLTTGSASVFATEEAMNTWGELTDSEFQIVENAFREALKNEGSIIGGLYEDKAELDDENGEKTYEKGKAFDIKTYEPDDLVRVIVELKEAPAKDAKENKTKANGLKKGHDKVKKDIKDKGIKGNYRHDYTIGVNGFSMETEYKNVKEIKNLPEVHAVSIATVYEHQMTSSKDLVGVKQVWEERDLQGEGMIISVIDSGIDYNHQDMKLTEDGKKEARLTPETLKEKFDKTEVEEVYYTDKVPTGYDWADKDNDAMTGKNFHGTHVAGTVGAYGDENNEGVIGVAPGAQILSEKVFSDKHRGAYADDIIAAIQHSVEMGADVINMSLGATSGTVDENYYPEQKAIRNATEQGTMVIVAGGNDYYSTLNAHPFPQTEMPYAENPDIGLLGTPGIAPYALQVASYENAQYRVEKMTLSTKEEFGYKIQNTKHVVNELGEDTPYELVYCNKGSYSDFKGIDVKGKIAVVKMDNIYGSYTSTQVAAKNAGAVAVILNGVEAQGDYFNAPVSSYHIPVVTTSFDGGNAIIDRLKDGEDLSISFSYAGLWVDNASAETMSGFSSWGAPVNLDFKPEISAPGGKIYSTVGNNGYEVYSGTSMATPHVAGGSALVLQSLIESGEVRGLETALKAKIMLMNTSEIVYDKTSAENTPYSPRKQGAGLMQIDKAIESPALVYERNTSLEEAAAVALKEIEGNKAKFNLTLEALNGKNVPKEVSYDIYVDVLTDETVYKEYDNEGDGEIDRVGESLTLKTMKIQGAEVKINGKRVTDVNGTAVTVKNGKKRELNVEIDLSKATNLNENAFVEGFVRFVPRGNEEIPELVVPYMGFYGDWTSVKNIDAPAYNEQERYMGYTVLWDQILDTPLGFDTKTGKFNKNAVVVSTKSITQGPYTSFTALRNLKEVELYVEDESGNQVKYITNFDHFTGKPLKFGKNIMPYRDFSYNMEGYIWDLTDKAGNSIKDGKYNFVIKTTLDLEGAESQYTKLPIKVDSIAPEISNIQMVEEDGRWKMTWDAQDDENGCGYVDAFLYADGMSIERNAKGNVQYFDEKPEGVVFAAFDYARNLRYQVYGDPVIDASIMIPIAMLTRYDVNYEKPVKVTVMANKKLDWTVKIFNPNGEEIKREEIKNQDAVYSYKWSPDKGMPDGRYYIVIEAVDEYGFSVATTPGYFNVVNNK